MQQMEMSWASCSRRSYPRSSRFWNCEDSQNMQQMEMSWASCSRRSYPRSSRFSQALASAAAIARAADAMIRRVHLIHPEVGHPLHA
eukprot:5173104-Prymnesium_polylepis.1